MLEILYRVLLLAPPLLVAVILHEVSHGYVARWLGDPTAASRGRLTLNPIKHIDPVMTILLPAMLIWAGSPVIFGGAKPVPVDPRYFSNPRRGMALVALAGPVTNLALALLSWILLQPLITRVAGFQIAPGLISFLIIAWLSYGILINLVLALFNLFPIPPLDGGRIAVGFLPRTLALPLARLEPYGLLIVFALLYFGVVGSILDPLVHFALQVLERIQ